MKKILRSGNQTIARRLIVGFMAVLVLGGAAALVGLWSMQGMSQTIGLTLSDVRAEAQLAANLSSNIAQVMSAGSRYVDTRDSSAQAEFRRLGWSAHQSQRSMNLRDGQSPEEISLLAAIEDAFGLPRLGAAKEARPLTDLLPPRTR